MLLPLTVTLTGCFTGVEGTRRIELSKADKKLLEPTAEETFLSDIKGIPYNQWKAGKAFYVTDNKAALAFSQKGMPSDPTSLQLAGKNIVFERVNVVTGLNGEENRFLVFSSGSRTFEFPLSGSHARKEIGSDELPMMTDLDLVKSLQDKLKGKTLWTRSSFWYDESGKEYRGRRFVPVTIEDVRPGSGVYPFRVDFTDDEGLHRFVYLSFTGSRRFPALFLLSDPALSHPEIDPAVWKQICNEKVSVGMTKNECSLALGNPDEVDSGHNYSYTLDIWKYSNGTTLMFEDGILKEIH